MYKTFEEILEVEIKKFNPYHDKLGRFCGADGASFMTFRTKDPKKQHMADAAVAREKERKENATPKKVGIDSIEKGDWDTLQKYTEENIGMTITQRVKDTIEFDCVVEVAKGIEWVHNEFPKAKFTFGNIDNCASGNNTIMSATSARTINFNPKRYGTSKKLEDAIKLNMICEYSPKGSTIKSFGVHEAAHLLEYTLNDIYFPVMGVDVHTLRDNYNSREKSKASAKIVSEACSNAKKTDSGRGKVNKTLKKEISGYAVSKTAETLAESVADVFIHGDDAATLSKEVFKILKRELE